MVILTLQGMQTCNFGESYKKNECIYSVYFVSTPMVYQLELNTYKHKQAWNGPSRHPAQVS